MKWMLLAAGLFLGACGSDVFDCDSPDLYRPCDEVVTAWAQEDPENRGAYEGFWIMHYEFTKYCGHAEQHEDPRCMEVKTCESERAEACEEEE